MRLSDNIQNMRRMNNKDEEKENEEYKGSHPVVSHDNYNKGNENSEKEK